MDKESNAYLSTDDNNYENEHDSDYENDVDDDDYHCFTPVKKRRNNKNVYAKKIKRQWQQLPKKKNNRQKKTKKLKQNKIVDYTNS